MTPSRRDHLRWLAAMPFAAVANRAAAMRTSAPDPAPVGAFAGTWSGMVADEGGRMSRFRLVITPAGGVELFAVDIGLVDARGTETEWHGATMAVAFADLGVAVRGKLLDRDRMEAVVVADGQSQTTTLVRGDLYAVAVPKLPPGPMDAARLRSLLLLSEAPGIGIGWATRGGPRHLLVDGVRSLAAAERVTAADAWHIGSITKSMTATLAARLVEAGRLRWTGTVGEVLGSAVPTMRTEYRQATLVDLLSHHAGLPRDAPAAARTFPVGPVADVATQRLAYARLALTAPPVAAPRTTLNYSNAGYVVAGAMLERVTGTPWEVLMRRHLFAPLDLRGAGFGPPAASGRTDQPVGHARGRDGRLHPWTDPAVADIPTVLGPAGLVHASLDDLLAYLAAHRDRPARLLTREGWDRLHTPPFGDGYALGWGVDTQGSLAHAGSNGMWIANVAVDRPSGTVFAGALNAPTPQAIAVLRQASEAVATPAPPIAG